MLLGAGILELLQHVWCVVTNVLFAEIGENPLQFVQAMY